MFFSSDVITKNLGETNLFSFPNHVLSHNHQLSVVICMFNTVTKRNFRLHESPLRIQKSRLNGYVVSFNGPHLRGSKNSRI